HGVTVKVKLGLGRNEGKNQAISGGLGISVLSRHTLLPDIGDLTILNVEHFPIKRDWYMVYPSGKQLSIVARTYFEYLLDAAKQIAEQTASVSRD
ncbi:MAG: LysR substrate-binding domain-containing protein, partial [Fischerella sp.]|nr:LysR substrate-binding domain-containing protein [Fischerella sp.]